MAPLLSSDLRLTGPRYVWLHIVHIYLVLVLVTVQYSTVQYSTVLVLVNVLKVVQLQHNLLAYLLWLKKVILQTSLSSLSALNTHFTEHIHSLELSTKFLQIRIILLKTRTCIFTLHCPPEIWMTIRKVNPIWTVSKDTYHPSMNVYLA